LATRIATSGALLIDGRTVTMTVGDVETTSAINARGVTINATGDVLLPGSIFTGGQQDSTGVLSNGAPISIIAGGLVSIGVNGGSVGALDASGGDAIAATATAVNGG